MAYHLDRRMVVGAKSDDVQEMIGNSQVARNDVMKMP